MTTAAIFFATAMTLAYLSSSDDDSLQRRSQAVVAEQTAPATHLVLLLIPKTRMNVITLNIGCLATYAGVYIEKGMGLIIPGLTPDTLGEIYEYVPSTTLLGHGARVAPRYDGRTSSESKGSPRAKKTSWRPIRPSPTGRQRDRTSPSACERPASVSTPAST